MAVLPEVLLDLIRGDTLVVLRVVLSYLIAQRNLVVLAKIFLDLVRQDIAVRTPVGILGLARILFLVGHRLWHTLGVGACYLDD